MQSGGFNITRCPAPAGSSGCKAGNAGGQGEAAADCCCLPNLHPQWISLGGHDGGWDTPIAVAGAAADGPHPQAIGRARRQPVHDHAAGLRINARFHPRPVPIRANLHLIGLRIEHGLQAQQQFRGGQVLNAHDCRRIQRPLAAW
jgi:hypothetical protein